MKPAPGVRFKRPDIQGLRAVAILLVVAYHAGWGVPGGFTGVDVFFVISGFVITSVLRDELAATGRIAFGRFYARRIKRLLPALAVVIAFVALVGILASPAGTQRTSAITGVASSFFAANFYLYHESTGYYGVTATLNPLLHTWTLGVEEQFYLLFPLLLFVGWTAGKRFARRRVLGAALVVGGVSAMSFALALELTNGAAVPHVASPDLLAFYGSPTRAWEFGCGALVALAVVGLARLAVSLQRLLAVVGVALIGIGAFTIESVVHFPGVSTLLPVAGAAAILAAGCSPSSTGVSNVLATRPLTWIGDRSYSWYLWHWPCIVFARALVPEGRLSVVATAAAISSLVPAALSFRYVENPIRTDARMRGRRVVALAGVCIAVPVCACAVLVLTGRLLEPSMTSWLNASAPHAEEVHHCVSARPLGAARNRTCTWAVPGSRGLIVLIGDSNAGQFAEPVTQAAAQARLTTIVADLSACPFLDAQVEGSWSGESACQRFDTGSLRWLVHRRPNLVIIAARSDYYIHDPVIGLRRPAAAAAHDERTKAVLWEEGLASTLRQLAGAGIPALVIYPVPHALRFAPTGCAVVRVLVSACGGAVSRADALKNLAAAYAAERRAVRSVAGATGVNLIDDLCTPRSCPTVRGRTFMYRDADHLSVEGSATLTHRFYAEIDAHRRKG